MSAGDGPRRKRFSGRGHILGTVSQVLGLPDVRVDLSPWLFRFCWSWGSSAVGTEKARSGHIGGTLARIEL